MTKFGENFEKEIKDYLTSIRKFTTSRIQDHHLKGEDLIWINMDEVPVFLDMTSGRTYHKKGDKNVEIKATTGTKARITVILAITSFGGKLPPYIICKTKNKTRIQNPYPDYCVVEQNLNGWITEQLLLDWLDRIHNNLNIPPSKEGILVFDRCSVHTKDSIKDSLEKIGKKMFLIPGGCTGLLQPLDVSINKPFKDYLRQYFQEWFQNVGSTIQNTTPQGYLKPPSFGIIFKWVLGAWNRVQEETIKHSFKYCGILVIFIDLILNF